MDPKEPERAPAPPPPAPKRMSRWKKVLLIAGGCFLGLVLLVLLAGPAVIASVARSKIPAALGEALDADVSVGDVSFSWSGRIELSDLRVVPKGLTTPLLELRKIDARVALGQALSGTYAATVEVVAPRVVIERRPDGRFNYEVPPRPPKVREPREASGGARPVVRAVLRVKDGEIVVKEGGRETVLRALALEAKVDTLEKPVELDLSLADPSGGRLSVRGAFDLDRRSGPVAVTLERLSLANLAAAARAYGNLQGLDGALDGKLSYEFKGAPRLEGEARLDARDVVVDAGGRRMKLERLELVHRGAMDAKGAGRHVVEITSGKALGLSAEVDVAEESGALSVDGRMTATSDLAALGDSLRGLLELKPGVRLEGKADLAGRVRATGAGSVSFDVTAGLADLAAVLEKSRTEIDKSLTVKARGAWSGATRALDLESLRLDSSFATADARGGAAFGDALDLKESAVRIEADLEKLAGKLSSFMEKPPRLGGRAAVDAKVAGERIAVDAAFKSARFETYGPFDGTLKHEGTLDKDGNGTHALRIESGKALAIGLKAGLRNAMREDRAVAADLRLDGDLAALSAMLPGLLELQPGTELAGTAAVEGKVETKGSSWARFDLAATLTGLESVEKATGKRREIDPSVTARAAGVWDGKKRSVDLEALKVDSSAGAIDAKGGISLAAPISVRESSVQLKADLGKLGAKLALFMADAPRLAGTVSLEGGYAGDRVRLDGAAQGLKVETTEVVKEGGKEVARTRTIGPIDATVNHRGTFSAGKDGALAIEECRLVSSAFHLKVSGQVRRVTEETREGELKVAGRLVPAELSKILPDLNLGGAPVDLEATLGLRPGLIALSGRTKLDGLTLVSKDPATGQAVAKTAKTGPLDFSVDLKGKDVLARVRTPLFEWTDKAYAARGGIDAEVAWGEKGTTGTTKISDLEIVDEKKNAVKDPQVTLVHDLTMTPREIEIRKAEITSSFLRGRLAGSIRNRDLEPEFVGVTGSFRYAPDTLGKVLAPWLPGKIEGAGEKALEIRLEGKVKDFDLLSVLRGARGSVEVDLAKFTTAGMALSGRTRLDLKDGKATAGSPLAVNQGKTDLDTVLDFRPADQRPRSTFDFRARDVDANADMAPLLESINPIFHTVNGQVQGKTQADFKLAWAGPIDPAEKDWAAAATKFLSGTGRLAVQDLAITGSPAVAEIMTALGEGNQLRGELLGTDVRIADGVCQYQNMTLKLARYELRFTGWVSFDKRMELVVEMPMTEGLVRRYPNLQKYLGKTFFVPLQGTVAKPRLDMEKVIAELVKRSAEGLLQDKAKDLLEDLLKKKKKK